MQTLRRPVNVRRMATVREAFRMHRIARSLRSRWRFYLEHNLFAAAQSSRLLMMEHLTRACQQWRLTLGVDR